MGNIRHRSLIESLGPDAVGAVAQSWRNRAAGRTADGNESTREKVMNCDSVWRPK